jgi:hypothetical protein
MCCLNSIGSIGQEGSLPANLAALSLSDGRGTSYKLTADLSFGKFAGCVSSLYLLTFPFSGVKNLFKCYPSLSHVEADVFHALSIVMAALGNPCGFKYVLIFKIKLLWSSP